MQNKKISPRVDGNLKQRQKLQNLVFPSGLGYDKSNVRVRTPKVNAIFDSIPILPKEISNIKNGEPIPVNQFSNLVTQTFESSNLIEVVNQIYDYSFFKSTTVLKPKCSKDVFGSVAILEDTLYLAQ
jgi:hypothetical protein